ncbi:Predicted DNA-binding transcriptional regulator YafY, contains an HTH and WYL domains [Oceanobacillus limi]|uniref:Predicted DNA-binding transcriptional regulator YafY, contains an HTH and WYL domains n=1 Tax=Oceanobacillus limi TaxID=930131 RepID=A0A1H9Y143_9BACI|nr:WYL domain-containing protein [Oceanobacillus limi]SES61946.1 Predicted DNA-binding transcriptional regulator YafY, contains an HTH and WYL domains [Oceanobacillus limi]
MGDLRKSERILGLIDVLHKYTDEDHELTAREILDLLHEELEDKVEIHESAIKRDLKELEDSSYIELMVHNEKDGLPKYYSYQDRLFEIQELRLLMDAISSARFITKKDKENLLGKIKQLTSKSLASHLENQIHIEEYAIHEAKRVKYTVFTLHHAIHEKRVIRFNYGRYNIDKEFVLSNDGEPRELEPYALVWNNDYYYLIGKFEDMQNLLHLRVDRMLDVELTDQTFRLEEHFDISAYVKRVFQMFTGVEKDLKVRFKNGLINVIIDRFGKDVSIEKDGEDRFILRTKAIISDGLVGWMLNWGSDAEVIDPPELRDQIKEASKKLYELYHGEEGP